MAGKKIRPHARWLSALIVAITLVAILAGALALHYVETTLVAAAGESLTLAAVDIADKLDMLMVERYGDIQLLSRSVVFQGRDHAAMGKRLFSLLDLYPVYRWAGVTDAEGRVLVATERSSEGRDLSREPSFLAVKAGQRAIVQDAASDKEGGRVVTFVSPLHDARGAFIGTVMTHVGLPVLEDAFARTVNALQAQWGTGARIEYLFLDHDGKVFVDSFLREEGQLNLKRLGVPSAQLVNMVPAGFIEEPHGRRGVEVVTGYAQTKGTEDLKGLRWGVLVRVDRSDVLIPIKAVLWKVGLWGGAFFLPMLSVLLWMVMRLKQEREREQLTQAKLQESHTFLQSTLDALTSHIAILDEQGTIVAVNGMWRQFAVDNQLHDPHRTIGKNYLEVCDTAAGPCSEEAKGVAEGIRALLQGVGNQCMFEYPCHGPDRQRWFAVRISRFDLDGFPRLVVVHEDITVNKLAVQAILQLSETARLVISNALDAHIMIDEQGIIVGWNPQAGKMFGWPEGEAMGRRVSETIVPPNYREAHERDWRHFLTGGTGSTLNKRIELVGRHRDGWQFPIEVSVTLVEKQGRYTISAFVRDLTERKRAESDQTRLLTILNASLNEIYVFSTDTLRFIYVNQSALDNLGYTLEAMQALTPIDIKPEMTEASFRELVNPLLTGEQAQLIFQTVHQRKNCSTYSVEVHLQVVGQGEERTFLALIYDVTARMQQEHRQATQYAITRLLLDSNTLEEAAPHIMGMICRTLSWNVGAMWRVDEEKQALCCAEIWEEEANCAQFIECTRQSNFAMGIGLPGRVWKSGRVEWIIDVAGDDNFPRAAAASSAGLHAALAFSIGSRDRFYGVMEFFATELREPDQKLLDMCDGLAGQISQFLDRKQVEQNLRNAKTKAEEAARERAEILAAVDAFFICINGEGAVTTWTSRAEAIFGISLDEALGRPFTELPIRWSWGEVRAAMGKASDTIKSIRVDKVRLAQQNMKEIFLKLTVSPICDDRGVTYVFMGEDISDRLALEHDLVQAQKIESIGHLAAGIAHEINTPTQFVGDNVRFLSDSFSDLFAVLDRHRALLMSAKNGVCAPDLIEACEAESRRADLDYLVEEIPKAITQTAEGINRIATIVRAMKEFAHPGSDEKICVDLNKAIESTVTVARNEWKYIADLTTDLTADLPLVPCLLGQFNQVILNMIVNATHAIADVVKGTGSKGTITITTRRVDGWAEVRITDSGTGIPEEIRGKIFDPFFTTKEVGKGTGQGLAIAHSVIVDKHQGTIVIESAMGRGTTFIVRLPLELQVMTDVAEMAA